MVESVLTDVPFDQLLPGCIAIYVTYESIHNSEPIAMHEPYKSDDISCENTFGVNNGTAK